MVLQTQVCEGVPQESRSAEIRKIVGPHTASSLAQENLVTLSCTHQREMQVIIITATTIPMLLLRIISRHLVVAEFWYDDWVLGGAAVSLRYLVIYRID